MKKLLLCILGLIITIAIYALTFITPGHRAPVHRCIDGTHATCDGNCECDGLGCFKPAF